MLASLTVSRPSHIYAYTYAVRVLYGTMPIG